MRHIFSPRAYHCKCKTVLIEYVWSGDLDTAKFKCPKCKAVLSNKNLKKAVEAAAIRTPTKNR